MAEQKVFGRVHRSPVVFRWPVKKGASGHTTGVLVFAGMNGNPFGGFLFSHVTFFEGEADLSRLAYYFAI